MHSDDIARALAVYPQLRAPIVEPLHGGLINKSFAVSDGPDRYVLQQVSPIFSPAIQENIAAVTAHLRERGFESLELLRTRDGGWLHELEDGSRWRLLTRMPGVTFDRCKSPEQARAASHLVARFHGALADLRFELRPLGIVLHDPAAHLHALHTALHTRSEHRLARDVARLAARIFALAEDWEPLDDVPARPAHGDLKFNNILFAGEDGPDRHRAVTVIDLDTLSPLPLWAELGDAWRSWCNGSGEERGGAELDLALFHVAATSYLEALTLRLTDRERDSLSQGLERISLELAARFARDALEERYFGWDSKRFETAGEHNLLRSSAQLSLAEQARTARAELTEVIRTHSG